MRLVVYCDGSVIATMPRWTPESFMEKFIREKAGWILGKLLKFQDPKYAKSRILGRTRRRDYLENKKQALVLVEKKLDYFNRYYGYAFSQISIRNQKTRWGSCSRKGNLNFNWKIIFLAERQQDYIIVHELCHLGEFNHSHKFWRLVEKTVPDYKEIRKEIRRM